MKKQNQRPKVYTLEEEWENYRRQVIPNVTNDSVQYEETQKAFYAGALVVYGSAISLPDMDERDSLDYLDKLRASLLNFRAMVIKRDASRIAESN